MLAWLPFALATLTLFGPLGHGEGRCKYSVRDVAFVNVHGKSWQLELVKPGQASVDFDLAGNSQILTDALAQANLGFVWHDAESAAAKRLGAESNQTKIQMFLTNRQGQIISVASKETSFAARIEEILSSPTRARLIDQLTDSLCVFLVVLGPNESRNREAMQTVNAAIAQVEKQMWMMEKASDKGPSLVEVNAQEIGRAHV